MKLKICGVRSVDEAQELAELGVDFIGLNFVPSSSRLIDLDTGQAIAVALKDRPVKVVTLFQNQLLEFVQRYVSQIKPDYAQLHGDESGGYISKLDVPVIKAITPDTQNAPTAAYYLLDRAKQGQGAAIDAVTAAVFVRTYPNRGFLAGGLTPENLAGILGQEQPFAIDIAGGVRTNDHLDFAKVNQILEIVRSI